MSTRRAGTWAWAPDISTFKGIMSSPGNTRSAQLACHAPASRSELDRKLTWWHDDDGVQEELWNRQMAQLARYVCRCRTA